jgi:hypothetical protein
MIFLKNEKKKKENKKVKLFPLGESMNQSVTVVPSFSVIDKGCQCRAPQI